MDGGGGEGVGESVGRWRGWKQGGAREERCIHTTRRMGKKSGREGELIEQPRGSGRFLSSHILTAVRREKKVTIAKRDVK